MSLLRSLKGRFRGLFRKSAAERDLDDEVQQYLSASIAGKMREGLSTVCCRAV